MKILIMGAGAVGAYFGSILSREKKSVTLVARGKNYESMVSNGLKIESVVAGNFVTTPRVIQSSTQIDEKFDLILFSVKGYDSEEAIEFIKTAVGNNTVIVTLQNGVSSRKRLVDCFGDEQVLQGVTYIDSTIVSPGVISQSGGVCNILFGEHNGQITERVKGIKQALTVSSGMDVQIPENINVSLWEKMAVVCTLAGMSCLTREEFVDVFNNPTTFNIAKKLIEEVIAVGKGSGIPLKNNVFDKTIGYLAERNGQFVASMYVDLKNGRPIELYDLNGGVASIGQRVGVPTPINDLIHDTLAIYFKRSLAMRNN